MARRKYENDGWPLGAYLREQRGKMAIREAARRADISESRWRQVEAGVQTMGRRSDGTLVETPVHPRPETVAAMCRAISADVTRGLELAGHNPKQYAWLIDPHPGIGADDETREWFTSLPREEREAVLAELQRLHVDTEVQRRPNKRGA